jgi:hypothetical protein
MVVQLTREAILIQVAVLTPAVVLTVGVLSLIARQIIRFKTFYNIISKICEASKCMTLTLMS